MIDPGTQENGEDYLAYNRRRWGSDGWTHSLRAKGRKVGAPFADWKIWPNTLRAHQLLRFAPRETRPQLKKAMFEAIYENGENVSDPEVVCRLASEAGVDVEGFRRVLDTPAAQQDVRRACAGQTIQSSARMRSMFDLADTSS